MPISVFALQKNISITSNLKEKKKSLTEELAGSMKNGIIIDDLDKAISEAYADAMMKEYFIEQFDKDIKKC